MALTDKLTAIADAIRAKTGGSAVLTLPQMAQAISAFQKISVPMGSMNSKCFNITLSEDVSGRQLAVNSGGDADIAAHRSDTSFVVGVIALNITSVASLRAIIAGNNNLHSVASGGAYGIYMCSSTSGVAGVYLQKAAGTDPGATIGSVGVDSNGVINIFASSSYPLKAGSYMVVCGWESEEQPSTVDEMVITYDDDTTETLNIVTGLAVS